jgi:preprotein translocase subunit SecG
MRLMGAWSVLLLILLFLTSLFMIVLVLIQRGKGGGLAGAFGGMGGQSAFGTKAGDLFTKITIGVAVVWIVLCLVTLKVLSKVGDQGPLNPNLGGAARPPANAAPAQPGAQGQPESPPTGGAPVAPAKDAPAPKAK